MILSFVACATGGMKLLFPKMDIHARDRHTESDFDIYKSNRDGQVFRLWAVPLKTGTQVSLTSAMLEVEAKEVFHWEHSDMWFLPESC